MDEEASTPSGNYWPVFEIVFSFAKLEINKLIKNAEKYKHK